MLTEAELSAKLQPLPAVWLTAEERMCLLKYADLSQGPIVEIGTAWGGSACILVLGSDKQVVSIDPMEPPLCNVDGYNITADEVRAKVHDVVGSQWERWTLWTVTSQCAAEYYAKWSPDYYRWGLVFIDGNHDYDYVKQDVALWLPLIQKGGYLLLHDSVATLGEPTPSQIGPTKVAQELKEDKRVKLIETAYSITAWEVI